jgi:hypothetical protein
MKVEARVFEICAAFFFLCAIVYSVLAKEPAGSAALYLVGGMGLIIGTYFRFVSRRLRPRPEDNPEAEIAEGAGDMGFFSPGSYWPIGVAAAATLLGFSIAFFYVWAIVISMVILLFMVGGLLFEYYIPRSDH